MMVETEPARYEKAEVPSSIATTLCVGGGHTREARRRHGQKRL